jgi:hypothetical protein
MYMFIPNPAPRKKNKESHPRMNTIIFFFSLDAIYSSFFCVSARARRCVCVCARFVCETTQLTLSLPLLLKWLRKSKNIRGLRWELFALFRTGNSRYFFLFRCRSPLCTFHVRYEKIYHTKRTSATKTTTTTLLDDNAPRNERVLFLLLPISYSFVTASHPVFSN